MSPYSPTLIPPEELVTILNSHQPGELLILDLRVFAQYAQSRITGALNLCIPTTLLKRPAYSVKKLAETFSNRQDDKAKFESWREVKSIIVYDAASWTLVQAGSCVQIINKFINEKWQGTAYVLKGGLNAFAKQYPGQLDNHSVSEGQDTDSRKLSIDPSSSGSLAGGCAMPTHDSVKPFFNTIRQNMDLIGGVGQFPLRRPGALTNRKIEKMPAWLRQASEPRDQGKNVANKFLAIEKAEQQRMQKALSHASWQGQKSLSPQNFRVAGIEKGIKNRYKDILPFENTRVKLGEKNHEGCDYVNASHIRTKTTSMHYIACQAPVPSTFEDFWRVIWEQGARVIAMLTAESEEGHQKAHPYWTSGDYGAFKVDLADEIDEPLHYKPDLKVQRTFSSPPNKPFSRNQKPPLNRRHTSGPNGSHLPTSSSPDKSAPSDQDAPHVTIRRLKLTNTSNRSQPPRPISQVQFPSWPDTGATARPKDILALVDVCDSLDTPHPSLPQSGKADRPLIVHCSAGCGRTGTFCTVANVKRMLMKQLAHTGRSENHSPHHSHQSFRGDDAMDVDGDEWMKDEHVDLIAQTVSEFRLHRMSMVQTLRQFVLCYEAIMELFVHDDWNAEGEGGIREEAESSDNKMDVDVKEPTKLSIAPSAKRPGMGKRALSGI